MSTPPPEVVIAAIRSLESEFTPYQVRYIYDNSRFVVCEKSVRIGITYAHAYKHSKKRAFRDPNAKRANEIFSSKNRDIAKGYLDYHRKWALAWNSIMGESFIDLSKWTTEKAVYPGGDVAIVSSDPDGFRGLEGDVSLDEICFHDRQEDLFSAAQSRIQWLPDGQVSLISSHSHPETPFNRIVGEIRAGQRRSFSLHSTTLPEAVEQGLALKAPGPHRSLLVPSGAGYTQGSLAACNAAFIQGIRDTCLSDEDYAREYLCRPAALSEMVWPDVYDAVAWEQAPDFIDHAADYGKHGLFVGIDCGRSKDSTVVWVLQRGICPSAGHYVYRTVCVKVLEKMNFDKQFDLIARIITHPQVAGGYIDQGAQGRALADKVWPETGYLVKPIGMGQKNKGDMAELLRAYAQCKDISFPEYPKTKQSICCIRREATMGGGLKYTGSTSFDHGDRFWAAALALYSAEGDVKSPLYLPDQSQTTAA